MMYSFFKNLHPRSQFTKAEDATLKLLVEKYGTDDWVKVAKEMTSRDPRQCKERWFKYLSPDISHAEWTLAEDELLQAKYNLIGSRWHKIQKFFPKRTEIMLRNRWNLLQRRQMKKEKQQAIPYKRRRNATTDTDSVSSTRSDHDFDNSSKSTSPSDNKQDESHSVNDRQNSNHNSSHNNKETSDNKSKKVRSNNQSIVNKNKNKEEVMIGKDYLADNHYRREPRIGTVSSGDINKKDHKKSTGENETIIDLIFDSVINQFEVNNMFDTSF
ncbi:Myb-like DNA-binding domain containing protein [Tritrichomonas foetus]|uniref:Myb-like DNA-binding domain containing protein n=1 Tax=Tritrichomonas foetus TaxID=1144522 RepID=A0A1J4J4K3_9EUKA|nr:Myb-like DNA-binding domain containing protein [Tritrichomonas foetus]|eukprot:OHS93079.1 Myb-like DNA-binding domain containing protein [Tritrichomonas foetus]